MRFSLSITDYRLRGSYAGNEARVRRFSFRRIMTTSRPRRLEMGEGVCDDYRGKTGSQKPSKEVDTAFAGTDFKSPVGRELPRQDFSPAVGRKSPKRQRVRCEGLTLRDCRTQTVR